VTTTGGPEEKQPSGFSPPGWQQFARLSRRRARSGDVEGTFSVVLDDDGEDGEDDLLPEQSSVLPGARLEPGDELVFTREQPQPYRYSRELIPPKEQTRRGILIGLSIAFVAVLLVQIVFAVTGGDVYERVGPILSTAATLIAAGWGYAWGHYFSSKDD
jgi:hypothetical protein